MNINDHLPPHFHAEYGDDEAAVLFNGDVFRGELPRRAARLVKTWARLHRAELEENWERLHSEQLISRIAPLP